ncbi:methyl-accepting chemotaxis protein [Paenibacillus sedimenti]|uniref:Methyl-accepting chemotaxis protein n=1 Tax=Paenibacillus sedimenti TaxID=2770274 RepID=A0A926KSD6_9BACL|nr:methyl-accepting chemotaxis protein [Paenibacillus sedimenti]MBD0381329.1 methyl-accepting chemotaxis protein [Paenibacillus sedimenti]
MKLLMHLRRRRVTFTMRTKLIVSFSLLFIIFTAVSVFNLMQVNQIKSQFSFQNQQADKQLLSLHLKLMANELDALKSAMMISKNTELVSPFKEKSEEFYKLVAQISETASNSDERKWGARLTNTAKEFTSAFDTAVSVVENKSLSMQDVTKQLETIHTSSQVHKEYIFELVDQFSQAYKEDAANAVISTDKLLDNTVNVAIMTLFIVLIFTLFISFVLVRSFMKPIQLLQKAVQQIAGGDLRNKINSTAKDELGMLSQNFDLMVDGVRSMLEHTQTIAYSLSDHSQRFREFSGATATANQEIIRSIQEISAGAEEQANHSDKSSAILSQLSTEIRQISDSTNKMLHTSREAAFNTHLGSKSMEALKSAVNHSEDVLHQVYMAMETLTKSSAQIRKIVGTITEISAQTNVLALNAAIEAARAGEHGRGFSVIAEEVRVLSLQTSNSSKGIDQIVQSLLAQMSELETSLGTAKQSFGEQNQKMNDSLGAFNEIRESMDELTNQIGQAHVLIEQAEVKNSVLVESVQHVASIAQETAAGVEEVNSSSTQQDFAIQHIATQSDDILGLALQLSEEINKFKISSDNEKPDTLEAETSVDTISANEPVLSQDASEPDDEQEQLSENKEPVLISKP